MRTIEQGSQPVEAPPPPPTPRSPLGRAWVAIALIPVFFVVAMAAGEGTISGLGYPVGGDYPWWVSLLSDLAAVVVVLVPCVAAMIFGAKAKRAGARRALIPVVIGAVVGLAWLVLTIVSEIGPVN